MSPPLKTPRQPRPVAAKTAEATEAAASGSQADANLRCPFCGHESAEYGMLLHMEEAHAEGSSPFVAKNVDGGNDRHGRGNGSSTEAGQTTSTTSRSSGNPPPAGKREAATPATSPDINRSSDDADTSDGSDDDSSDDGSDEDGEDQLAECTVEDCHEILHLSEMTYHFDLHSALKEEEAEEAEEAEEGAAAVAEKPAATADEGQADDEPDAETSGTRSSTTSLSSSASSGHLSRQKSVGQEDDRKRSASQHSSHHHHYHRHHHHRRRPRLVDGSSDPESLRDRGSDHRRHRERRERQRNDTRARARARASVRDGEPVSREHRDREPERRHDRRRQRALAAEPPQSSPTPHKPTKSIRSWLASWTGTQRREAPVPVATAPPPPGAPTPANKKEGAPDPAAAAPKERTVKRLGKAELGRYANEDRMPDWLAVYLKKEWGICHQGIVPVLKQLLHQSPTTEYAYLCDPCVQHVSRLPKEGGFCGYRNIQTMVSYIVGAQFPGHNLFGDDLPTIFDIQNLIENAWDMGISKESRTETGGIRLTRKYIGTPEALAMFTSLNIPCSVQAFNHRKMGKAPDMLLRDVEKYFEAGIYDPERKVRTTTLPPIYWQHPGHSLTIVGFEKTKRGRCNLLVFDPVFKSSSPIVRLVGRRRIDHLVPDSLLKLYRRGPQYLNRFRAFEVLKLKPRDEDVSQAVKVPPSVPPDK